MFCLYYAQDYFEFWFSHWHEDATIKLKNQVFKAIHFQRRTPLQITWFQYCFFLKKIKVYILKDFISNFTYCALKSISLKQPFFKIKWHILHSSLKWATLFNLNRNFCTSFWNWDFLVARWSKAGYTQSCILLTFWSSLRISPSLEAATWNSLVYCTYSYMPRIIKTWRAFMFI